jgi:hypothetical protein
MFLLEDIRKVDLVETMVLNQLMNSHKLKQFIKVKKQNIRIFNTIKIKADYNFQLAYVGESNDLNILP